MAKHIDAPADDGCPYSDCDGSLIHRGYDDDGTTDVCGCSDDGSHRVYVDLEPEGE